MRSFRERVGIPTAVILAGGLGTRLRAFYPDCPKPMVPILGRPFIEYVVRSLIRQGVTDIVISVAYRGDQIEGHFKNLLLPARVRCVREPKALGTGGALAFVAAEAALGEWVFALNGDSLASFNMRDMLARACMDSDAVIVGVTVPGSNRYGSLSTDEAGMLTGFQEKEHRDSVSLINGGIYLIKHMLLPLTPPQMPESLELDYFPRWLREGRRIAVLKTTDPFIDIGTPESLAEAEHFIVQNGFLPDPP